MKDFGQEHTRMVNFLIDNNLLLAKALNLEKVWIKAWEVKYDPMTEDRVDLLFQDKKICKCEPKTVLYVVELKSDEVDHEVLGQLKKAVNAYTELMKVVKQWDSVQGLAIGKRYTESGLSLLRQEGYKSFVWKENNGRVELVNADVCKK